jgi:hypothetical protein
VPQGRASVGGAGLELPRAVAVAFVVPLLLLVVEFASCVASFPGSVDDEVPAVAKQEAGSPPVGCVAPCRKDALLVHALRLRIAGGEELDVAYREGRHSDIGEGAHVRGHLGKGADDGDEHPGAVQLHLPGHGPFDAFAGSELAAELSSWWASTGLHGCAYWGPAGKVLKSAMCLSPPSESP